MKPFLRYTFGSMSLGRNPAEVEQDLVVARRAMESGVWFHSSPTYNNGFTFTEFNLRLAASDPAVQTTIGGTASLAHLETFLAAAQSVTPLSPEILAATHKLQSSREGAGERSE